MVVVPHNVRSISSQYISGHSYISSGLFLTTTEAPTTTTEATTVSTTETQTTTAATTTEVAMATTQTPGQSLGAL